MTTHPDAPRRGPTTIQAEPYRWTFPDGHSEDGYRLHRGRQFLWLRSQEAYSACEQLAELLDAEQEGPTDE